VHPLGFPVWDPEPLIYVLAQVGAAHELSGALRHHPHGCRWDRCPLAATFLEIFLGFAREYDFDDVGDYFLGHECFFLHGEQLLDVRPKVTLANLTSCRLQGREFICL
jgi:hypothetical protein